MPADRRTKRVFRLCLSQRTFFRWGQHEVGLDWHIGSAFRVAGFARFESAERPPDRGKLGAKHECLARTNAERITTCRACLHRPNVLAAPRTIPGEVRCQDVET